MTEIINFLANRLAESIAQGVPADEARRSAEVDARAEFGGERVYVPSLPKQRRAVQVARLNLQTTREIVAATGMATRTVRRITRGK